jgi:hypothetical protein
MYYIDLFSPETYSKFSQSDQTVSGFRDTQRGTAKSIKKGDKFACYVTRLSRWVGILKIKSTYFEDDKPIFVSDNDPFTIRFEVEPLVWLPLEYSIPIHTDEIWNNLSFTSGLKKNDTRWTGRVRGSLTKLSEADGAFLEQVLLRQLSNKKKKYPITEEDKRKLQTLKVKTVDNKELTVVVPENDDEKVAKESVTRESLVIQSILAQIGERMNLKIWLPRNDRVRVLETWNPTEKSVLLDTLPMNYDGTTLKTIENIDVIWIKGRSIVRAFEIEHTTSIYSGILRMADLMALQPNLNIKAHIVAPSDRRDKVFQEISRPVFTLLEKGPLSKTCSFISYEAVRELAKEKRIEYMVDKVLEQYEDFADEQ